MKDWFVYYQHSIIMKCPHCGAYVELFYSREGFNGQGEGWYCPRCFTRLIPPHNGENERKEV